MVEKLINIEIETLNGFLESSMDSLSQDQEYLISVSNFKHHYKKLMHNAHTIKGNARILGFDSISEACHQIESDYTALVNDSGNIEELRIKHDAIVSEVSFIKFVNMKN